MDIQLGNSGLTKIVVFTPFYNILNKASYDIEVAEVDVAQAEWFTVLAGKFVALSNKCKNSFEISNHITANFFLHNNTLD